jgi:hypothetical protein
MDISMNEIDNITLSYFANKSQYTSILKKTEENNDKKFINDKKFYKKRVLDMTKRLFRDEETNAQLIGFFNTYVKSCVNYLKFLDKSDIIQEKYGSMNVGDDQEKTINEIDASGDDIDIENVDYKNCDYLFSKPEDVKKLNLDTFVIKTVTNPPQKIIPKRENINIKTKEHKTKGILKKKNIDNIYEDTTNEN